MSRQSETNPLLATLPTYEESIAKPSIWALLVGYLSNKDEVACAGTCQQSRRIFTLRIWENPIKYFGNAFKTHRLDLSSIPHHLRPLLKVIDLRLLLDGHAQIAMALMKSDQIRTFPNIEVILLHVDSSYYQGKQRAGGAKYWWRQRGNSYLLDGIFREYGRWPKILSAINVPTLDCLGLAPQGTDLKVPMELSHEQVHFLDFSYTSSVVSWADRVRLSSFKRLEVLKVRGVGLEDSQLMAMLGGAPDQLWSLDVRDNSLTDLTLRYLRSHCFAPQPTFQYTQGYHDFRFKAPPPYINEQDRSGRIDLYRSMHVRHDDVDRFSAEFGCGRFHVGMQSISEDPNGPNLRPGITHLYISGNHITSLGILELLSTRSALQVLDVGSVRCREMEKHLKQPYNQCLANPEIQRYLVARWAPPIEILRLHHSVVSQVATLLAPGMQHTSSHTTLPSFGLCDSGLRVLSPTLNHQIRELTLTALPQLCDVHFLARVTDFLDNARIQEAELVSIKDHRRAAPKHSGLRILRLEFLPNVVRQQPLSVSEDADADVFHQASEEDFSFFVQSKQDSEEEVDSESKNTSPNTITPVSGPECLNLVEALKKYRARVPRWGGRLELVFSSVEECQCLQRR